MKYAWIENEKIRDICLGGIPADCYHPDVAVNYDTEVPDDAENGDGWVDGALVKRPIPEPVVEQPQEKQLWNAYDIRNGLTLAEKVKWDNDSAPEIITVKAELPKDKAGAQELVDFLVAAQVISQASADKILA
jgi:hypothetical protein